jgi:hypothetical protein
VKQCFGTFFAPKGFEDFNQVETWAESSSLRGAKTIPDKPSLAPFGKGHQGAPQPEFNFTIDDSAPTIRQHE